MPATARPNIVVVLADDMGFSDIGAFGSEIATPHLDSLAESGVRFTQFYNSARCCPSRASLLTGVDPHVAGVGHMVSDYGLPGYRGYLGSDVVTIAEALRIGGYETMLSGKWHVGGEYHPADEAQWRVAGQPGHPTPRQRGFDHYYGTLTGGGSFFRPPTLVRDDEFIEPDSPLYHYTDAIGTEAQRMIDTADAERPFFLYLAYTAPHWPLHAWEEDIARYENRYRGGWDAVRTARHEELKARGIVDDRWEISSRDPSSHPWYDEQYQEWEDLRMATYAAQIEQMDRSIGGVLDAIRRRGDLDNTLVMFLSDNGGCAEFLREDGDINTWPGFYARPTLDGRPVHVGNTPGLRPGGDQTFMSYDLPWANASNSPFRLFKHWVHEGGIAAPFIASWPARLSGGICHAPYHVKDIMATCLEAAGVDYPSEYNGNAIVPTTGESFLPAAEQADGRMGVFARSAPIYWEHEGNRAVRDGEWKLVCKFPGTWELYNMNDDRTELRDLAAGEVDRVRRMSADYDAWAQRSNVVHWPVPR
ncbi:MAG: arylsulfatase [Spirochaetota bacterium]